MVELLFDAEDYRDEIKYGFIEKAEDLCQKILEIEGFTHHGEISLSLVTNEEIQKINKKYRKKDTKTDVLSFPLNTRTEILGFYELKNPQYIALGDIIISLEQGKEQAKEYNHSLERELLYLICHSVLHLLGYDHIKEDEKTVMRAKEEDVLSNLGINREY